MAAFMCVDAFKCTSKCSLREDEDLTRDLNGNHR